MSRTKAELAVEVAERLGALGAGESLSAEDQGVLYRGIEASMSHLAARRVANIPNLDNIPDAIFQPLADFIAEAVASKFGRDTNPDKQELAVRNIRATRVQDLTHSPARPDYF